MSLMEELKAEVTRLARKEMKKELESIKKVNASQRGFIASLRRDIADLQKEVGKLRKQTPIDVIQKETSSRSWITGRGIASLRKRLGLTQNEFAVLVDVSAQSIIKWEASTGKISFRSEKTAKQLQEIRSMGKREAAEKLAQLSQA